MNRDTPAGQSPLQALLLELQNELERAQKEAKEVEILIRQSSGEVEKLTQNNTRLANKVRQMEMNLETYPRQDIRELYTSFLESQMRLFMMRGQLEQLQSRQQHLTQYISLLQRIIETARAGAFPAGAPAGTSSGAPSIARIIEAQERERGRLARQMHDGPAQSLTNLILQAEICERLFDSNPAQARTELANLRSAVNATFQKVREFIFDLRPMMLDDLGLVPTLRRYLKDYQDKSGITVQFNLLGQERRLPGHMEVILFRGVQEMLKNVQKHAQASQSIVTLEFGQEAVTVSVEDNGVGFVPEAQEQSAGKAGALGIPTLREQAQMLGGAFSIESAPGRGTRAVLEIPLS